MSETMKVFWSCAIGAFIGTLVSLETNRYFWWVGLLAGGLTGYLSYEWRTVLRAIPAAYRAARGWQSPPLYWRTVGWMALSAASITSFPFLLFYSLGIIEGKGLANSLFLLPYSFFTILFTAILAIEEFYNRISRVSAEEEMEWRRSNLRNARDSAYWFAPPLVFFWHLPHGVKWVVRRLPRATIATVIVGITLIMGITRGVVALVLFLYRFTWQLFFQIHSEIRLLCGLDAAIGAAIGYFAGSAVIGALAGGLWGALNFEVLSIRILKLVPIEKSILR